MAFSIKQQSSGLIRKRLQATCLLCETRAISRNDRFDRPHIPSFKTQTTAKCPLVGLQSINRRSLHATSPFSRAQQQLQKQQQQKPKAAPEATSEDTAKSASISALHEARAKKKKPHVRARDGELVPSALTRPLGMPYPPEPGQNTGIDTRGWRQRRDDFVSYEKHLERRRTLIHDLYQKNYFRDIGNLGRVHKGKSMIAPRTPFKKEYALWFPNLRGRTLDPAVKGDTADTTPVLLGKVSIVALFNSDWGEKQTMSYTGEKGSFETEMQRHAKIAAEMRKHWQLVKINYEENWLKWSVIRLFFSRLRQTWKDALGNYFLVQRGLDDDIKEAMGIWNMKVGYVYLLDPQCRVRWVGNGIASDDERASLYACTARLLQEEKARPKDGM